MLCSRCATPTHRSRTQGFNERVIKALTSYRPYRCHECGWRGWLRDSNPLRRRDVLRTAVAVLITLVIATIFAMYLVDKLATK